MAVAAQCINICGSDQVTPVGNTVTGLTFPADHRLMNNRFQEARVIGTVGSVTRKARAPDAVAGMGLLKTALFNLMAGLAQIILQQECGLVRCMRLMTGATALLYRGMRMCPGKRAVIMAGETNPTWGIDQQTSIFAIMHLMAGTAAPSGKWLVL